MFFSEEKNMNGIYTMDVLNATIYKGEDKPYTILFYRRKRK